jgi:glucosyl-3-phosphoglycerate synthase
VQREVADWFSARTSTAAQWPLDLLLALKGPTRVSVVLPALDEDATVGRIVEAVHTSLGDGAPARRRARGRRLRLHRPDR